MPNEWKKLRTWHGSQQSAFEELCCQLAADEPIDGQFTRIGAPDAGVECYWTLPRGEEWGWQAKFFDRLGPSQWSQLDESLQAVIDKRPKIVKVIICLPLNLSDPRISGQTSATERWQAFKEKWQKKAKTKNRKLTLELWNETDILRRLTYEAHRGRFYFWFNQEVLHQDWFRRRFAEQRDAVGVRYTPELNVELPIASLFDGLCRAESFINSLKELVGKARRLAKAMEPASSKTFESQWANVSGAIDQLTSAVANLAGDGIDPIDWSTIVKSAVAIRDTVRSIFNGLKDIQQPTASNPAISSALEAAEPIDVSVDRGRFRELISLSDDIIEFAESTPSRLENMPALLLAGKAGTGKTHLFCDVASRRIEEGHAAVLLLGKQFGSGEPWSQITAQLGLDVDRDTFLAALDSVAQTSRGRALILVDGVNEGGGLDVWRSHFYSFLAQVRRYPRIAVALSVRNSYERLIVTAEPLAGRFVRAEHLGFANHQFDAAKAFFAHYGFKPPGMALIHSEFRNPLFLSVLCKTLKKRGMDAVPAGIQGISAVFDEYVDSIDTELSNRLKADPDAHWVRNAVAQLADAMAESRRTWLRKEDAKALIPETFNAGTFVDSLYHHLVAEGLLLEDNVWNGVTAMAVVSFSYERFGDYLITRRLLARHVDPKNPDIAFQPGSTLGHLFKDESACWQNNGLLEAFAVQVPEMTGRELSGLAPHLSSFYPVKLAQLESMVWRNPETLGHEFDQYLTDHIRPVPDLQRRLLEVVLTVCGEPRHPYNARYLHERLWPRSLAERDATWSIAVFESHHTQSAVDRLIDWTWSAGATASLSDDASELLATALAWLLTTSHRMIRDRATKALVVLLTFRIPVLQRLLMKFNGVNDPYVQERLYAVGYGCAMRTRDLKGLGAVACDIYRQVFQSRQPPPHVLLRDYARGIIECAASRGYTLPFDLSEIRPPYRSVFPAIPTETDVDALVVAQKSGQGDSVGSAVSQLHSSCCDHGDFYIYVISPNVHHWTNRLRGTVRPKTRQEAMDGFVSSLDSAQRAAWNALQERPVKAVIRIIRELKDISSQDGISVRPTKASANELKFRKLLTSAQQTVFDESVLSYLRGDRQEASDDYSSKLAGRWIFKRVVGSSRVDLQACKLEYSIVSPK